MNKQTPPTLPYLSDYARGKLLTEAGIKNARGLNYHRLRNLKPNNITNNAPSTYKKPVRCVETGEVFESIRDCARAHAVQPSHLSAHLKGKLHAVGGKHYKYASKTSRLPKSSGTANPSTNSPTKPSHTAKRPVRCIQTGEVFESLNACAKAHSIAPSNLCEHLKGGKSLVKGRQYEYAESTQPTTKHSRKAKPIRCIETGVTFRSLNSAAKTYNIPPNSIHQQLTGVYTTAGGKTFEYITPITTQLQLDKNV